MTGPMYLVATSSTLREAHPDIGVMIGPRVRGLRPIEEGRWWASDNDGYTGRFSEVTFTRHLDRLRPYAARCLFVAAPDVFGNAAATLDLFGTWRAQLEARDFPAAFIAQDGQHEHPLPETANWLFLAGSDSWREQHGAALIRQARDLGYWGVHIGRVNSNRRVRGAATLGVDSCDGTYLSYTGVQRGLADVTRWISASAQLPSLFDAA